MPEPPAIRVAPVTAELRSAVLGLRVQPEQYAFVSPIDVSLADAEQCPGSTPMTILFGGTPVGYYRIEHSARSVADRDFDVPALGLRSLFIDMNWQGRGFGTPALAALNDDLAMRHAEARLLVLTVNCRNLAARALYLRAGFVDSGELYHGGRSGPQHLMWCPLP
ncbi:GNAT family N-acetyltransferase [Dyella subtropica]|uniref:GNAT family N-acetyltransferase n=1 Tax=Dyella subtropica TaxID=2992127 RepID=UPI002255C309|nr:GNAT family N-acetyltransferase [Dyella subtropica]